jgi:hypothetical protein
MKFTMGKVMLVLGIAVCTTGVLAQNLEELDPERAQRVAEMLVAKAGQIESPQVDLQVDVAKASGMKVRDDGLLVVPQKGLSEMGDNTEVESEQGAPLAYLFMSEGFCPVVEGTQVAQSKLRILAVTDKQGVQRKAKCFLLAVRKVSDDDWRLYVYGAEKKPLVDVQFTESSQEKPGPIALSIDDVAGNEGTLTVTVFGKYQAGFRAAYTRQ